MEQFCQSAQLSRLQVAEEVVEQHDLRVMEKRLRQSKACASFGLKVAVRHTHHLVEAAERRQLLQPAFEEHRGKASCTAAEFEEVRRAHAPGAVSRPGDVADP